MSHEASQLEAAILRIERLIVLIDARIVLLEERVRKQEEWLAQLWVAPRFNATVVGYIDGCNSIGLAGAKVTIKDHATGDVLGGTMTTDANGKYIGAMRLTTSSPPQNVDIIVTPPAATPQPFAATTTVNTTLAYGPNTPSTITVAPASGYTCDVGVTPVLICTSGRICVTVADACTPSNPVVGATITVQDMQTPPNTIGTCTTDATGKCCVAITKQTAFTVSCALSGTTTQTQTVNGVCGVDTNTGFVLTGMGIISFTLGDCDGYTGGGTLAVTGPVSFTLTSLASGTAVTRSCPTGTYTGTVTYPGSSLTETVSLTVTNCTTAAINATYVNRITVCTGSDIGSFASYSVTLTDATSGTSLATGSGTFVSSGCYIGFTTSGTATMTLLLGAIPSSTIVNVNYTCPISSGTDHLGPYQVHCDMFTQSHGGECS